MTKQFQAEGLMRLVLEKRLQQSQLMLVMTPILSVVGVMIIGVVLFDALGFDGFDAVWQLFITPVIDSYKWRDVATKAAPLILIGLGLSIGNRAKIWNIGAEGQYIVGALAAAGIAWREGRPVLAQEGRRELGCRQDRRTGAWRGAEDAGRRRGRWSLSVEWAPRLRPWGQPARSPV